jgi:excisionase family DNA binding protein
MSLFPTDRKPARRLPLDDPIYRPRVIAERTGKNYHTITAAIRAGEMRKVRLGKRSIGVRASEVQAWLDRLENKYGRSDDNAGRPGSD